MDINSIVDEIVGIIKQINASTLTEDIAIFYSDLCSNLKKKGFSRDEALKILTSIKVGK